MYSYNAAQCGHTVQSSAVLQSKNLNVTRSGLSGDGCDQNAPEVFTQ